MIAEPLRFYDIIGDRLYSSHEKTLRQVFDLNPADIESLIKSSPNFYIARQDFEIMKQQYKGFEFCRTSQILNDLKNQIYFTYFNSTYLTQKPKAVTWSFVKQFILSYKYILYMPTEPVDVQDLNGLSPDQVEEKILFNHDFWLKNSDFKLFASTNSKFCFSAITLLLNELKDEGHRSYRLELETNSRLDWENKKSQ